MILSLFQSLPVPVTEIKPGCRLLEKYIFSAGTKNTVAGSIAELEGLLANRTWICFLFLFIIRKLEKCKCLKVSRPKLLQIYYKKH